MDKRVKKAKLSSVKDSPDRIYFNAQITNNNTDGSKEFASYSQSLQQPLLGGKAGDYNLSIVRFRIPSQDIQIFNFEPQPGPTPVFPAWSNITTYSAGNN